jgi:hypothetical protein
MARYNTAPQTLTVNGAIEFGYAFTGGIISLTGTTGYTVTLVSPVFFPGSKQTFYNATDGMITLESSAGQFKGNGVTLGTTVQIPTNSTYQLTSDGADYVLTSALAGTTTFELPVNFNALLNADGKVELNPADNNVEIKPTGTGLVDISPQSSVSIQPGAQATIRPVGDLTLGSSTGDVLLGDAGGTFTINGNIDLTGANQTVVMSPTGTGTVTINPAGNASIGSGASLSLSSTVAGTITNMSIGSTNPSTGSFTTVSSPTILATSSGASTSTTSGALIVTGGLGVGGAIFATSMNGAVGTGTAASGAFTTLSSNSTTTFTGNIGSTNTTTGTLIVTGGIGASGAIYAGSIQNTPIGSTSKSSGGFTTLTANSTVDLTGTTEATNATGDTGILRAEGGASIAKRVYSGGGFQGAIGNITAATGSFTTLGASSTVSITPAANVTISPSGSGTVTLSPAGGGSINNMSIGATTQSTGKFSSIEVTGNVDVARYLRHAGDTNTYLDFEGDEISIVVGGSQEVTVNGTGVRLGDTGNGYFRPVSGNYGSIEIDGGAHGGWEGYSIGGRAVFMHDNSNGMGLYDDVNNHWVIEHTLNAGTRTYYNGINKCETLNDGVAVTGLMRATAQVISYYSDERLKDFSGKIDGALDKVMSLNGYYYTGNEVAKSLGFTDAERQVGVSAQEVEAIMPEVVQAAPINDAEGSPEDADYKTVQYEKLVPLLIEAIKELKQEINTLRGDK